jgi:hypothetical protein
MIATYFVSHRVMPAINESCHAQSLSLWSILLTSEDLTERVQFYPWLEQQFDDVSKTAEESVHHHQ